MVGDEPWESPPRRDTQRVRVPTTEIERWINQFREEFRNHAADGNTITHHFQQFLEEHQRREENNRVLLEQRLMNFRNEYVETTRETAMSLIYTRQDLQSRGARFDRFGELVTSQLKSQVDGIQTEQDNMGLDWLTFRENRTSTRKT